MLSKWCKDNGVVINPNKNKSYTFRHPGKILLQMILCCGNDSIEYTDCYKYLGVEFTEQLSWAKVIESTSLKTSRAASYLIAKMRSSGAFVYTVYTHLYT